MGNELRPIVHAQMGRWWIQLEEFIDHVQELGGTAVQCLVELGVDRPDVMLIFREQQLPAATSRPRALEAARQGPLEPYLAPDPLHSLVIEASAIKP